MAAILMTLSDLQGHSPTANLFKCDFSEKSHLKTFALGD